MIIPWHDLDPETLDNLIESFVLREGTDYGCGRNCMRRSILCRARCLTAKATPLHRLTRELLCLPNIR